MFDIWYFCGWQFSIFVYVFFSILVLFVLKQKLKLITILLNSHVEFWNIQTFLYVLFLVVRKNSIEMLF